MRKSNYDKFPSTHTDGMALLGWDKIISTLKEQWSECPVWAIDLYVGTYEQDFIQAFGQIDREVVDTRSLMLPNGNSFCLPNDLSQMTYSLATFPT